MSQFGRPMVCVLGLDRANRLLLDHDPSSSRRRFRSVGSSRAATFAISPRRLTRRTVDPFVRCFRSTSSRASSPASRRFVRSFSRMSRARTTVVRSPSTPRHAGDVRCVGGSFYGIDETHGDFARLKALFHVIDTRYARWASRRRVDPASAEMAIIRRRAGESSPIRAACPGARASHPQSLSDRTVLGNLIYIMQVTWGDVTVCWCGSSECSPIILSGVRGSHVRRSRAAGDRRFVQETLRLEQSEPLPARPRRPRARRLSHPEGVARAHVHTREPSGRILLSQRDRVRPRPVPRPTAHARTIRAVRRVSARMHRRGPDEDRRGNLRHRRFVSGFDWRVVTDGPAEISSWAHNAPSRRLTVQMTPRAATLSASPRVSVVIPVYQGQQRIGRTLARLREQTFRDFEVVVVNDGSTDDTSSVVRHAAADDARIRLSRAVERRHRGRTESRACGGARSRHRSF